jgi:hypothetical protein
MGDRDLLVVIRENTDGSLMRNIMQAHDKALNKIHIGRCYMEGSRFSRLRLTGWLGLANPS